MKNSDKTDELIVEISGAIAFVKINRPEKMNSLCPPVLGAMVRALERFSADAEIRCVVLSGAGGKAFSAGYDFSFVSGDDVVRDYAGAAHPLADACRAIEGFPRPVIAMVAGYAMGGGLELALACDILICSADAKFSMPPAKIGIAYPLSGLKRFVEAVGASNVKRMFFAAETFAAEDALRMGIASEVVPPDLLKEKTRDLARRISDCAPLSVEAAKAGVNALEKSAEIQADKGRDRMREMLEKVSRSDDFKEGMRAVSEKRKPVFKGR